MATGDTTLPAITAKEDRPDYVSAAVQSQRPALQVIRDTMQGTIHMRNRGKTYLPQAPGESTANFSARVQRAVFFNAIARTVEGLAGMIFRRDPELGEDVPPLLREHWEDIDLAGTHGDVFARAFAEDLLAAGHSAILVDMPATGGARLSLGEERAINLRPYWVLVPKDRILSFRTAVEHGRTVLSQVVISETEAEANGDFGDREVQRYRVFKRSPASEAVSRPSVLWELWRKDVQHDAVAKEGDGVVANQDEIPLAIGYGPKKLGVLQSEPPLLDLAELNVAHWQVLSDHLTSAHMASIPVPVGIGLEQGEDPDTLIVGPNSLVKVPMGGDFKYAEHSGQALGATRQILEDLKGEMATLGLAMLQGEKRAAETAAAKRIDKGQSDSALAAVARAAQDAIEQALGFSAKYLKLGSGGSVTLNRDFENLTLSPQDAQTLSAMVGAGQLSLETMWARLREGNFLPEDFDPEVEKARIENEMPEPEPVPAALAAEGGPGEDEEPRAAGPATRRGQRLRLVRDAQGNLSEVVSEEAA